MNSIFGIEDELREFGYEVEDLYGNGDGNRNREVWQVLYWQKFFAGEWWILY